MLNSKLVSSPSVVLKDSESLSACLNSHGLYNYFHFVLRLSPEVHRKISNLPTGVISGGHDFEDLQAYSTLLHENIHWWQHIGSTSGFIQSLLFPVQAHMNYQHLKDFTSKVGPTKSLFEYAEAHKNESGLENEIVGLANIIVNNFYDLEYFRNLTFNSLNAESAFESNYFEGLGHSTHVTYANTIQILDDSFGKKTGVLPVIDEWEESFGKLTELKKTGFYFGSPIELSQIGNLQIYEGQARFNQLQFLYFASGEKLSWKDADESGMLHGVYIEAFQCFLELTGEEWPDKINHSIIGVFLIVCDIALNPGEGFPFEITNYENFIKNTNPGVRFFKLCRAIRECCPEVLLNIQSYSKDEYIRTCEEICKHADMITPLKVAQAISAWQAKSETIEMLMNEYKTFKYGLTNLPIRVLFSHFIAFMEDKLSRPEFFCWPGIWKTGARASNDTLDLFNKHMALFLDKAHDGGIYPRIIDGKDMSAVKTVFDIFYATNVTYDMTRQWIVQSGPFVYNYKWLSSNATPEDFKAFGDRNFKSLYGIDTNDFPKS